MSKIQNKQQAMIDKLAKGLHKQYGEPLMKCVFDVWGVYTWGTKKGQTNPNAVASVTYYGESFKHAKAKLIDDLGQVLYKPTEVIDMNPAYSRAYEELVAKVKADNLQAKEAA